MASHFFVSPQHASQYTLPEKRLKCIGNTTITLYLVKNAVKFPTMRSVEDFKSSLISSDCLPAGLPAVRPTSTRSMVPDFSHNKGNRVPFTKLLFR